MVAWRSLLTVSATVLATSVSVAGNNAFISVVENASASLGSLHARQDVGANATSSDVPDVCNKFDSCVKLLAISSCTTVQCICTNDISASIQGCYDCALNSEGAGSQSSYQSAADNYVATCKSHGITVNAITVSKDGNGGKNGAFGLTPTFGLLGLSIAAIVLV